MKRKWNVAPPPEATASEPTDTTRPPKRKRNVVHEAPTSEEVQSPRQLLQLLTFEQDLRKSRHGLQSCKDLLDSILNGDDDQDGSKMQIVRQYLEMTTPRNLEEEAPVYLSDIMETWSMAAQMSNENIMSAVVVVLALLLKVISAHVELVPTGLGIARTILQKRQQELLAKNLSADKGRDFIISPTLRLLREVICLDGGTLAIPTFRARNYTFKSLARNMGLRYLGEGIEDPKRPSVRTNAVRVLLSSLKFLHVEAKRDLLSQKDVVAALMRGLKEDPPSLIFEMLNTLRSSVILDQKLSRDVKIRLLNSQSLSRIASLYTYQHEKSSDDGSVSVDQAAHDFLLAACTTFSAGILRPSNGFYPDGIDPDLIASSENETPDEVGLESIPWMDKFKTDVPVRNSLLSDFIQTLKPWSSTKQNELLVAIFAACPELVANYFANKRSFSFDPKLSATWIGYSTLLFKTIQLDIPPYFGHQKKFARVPPPTAVVLGHILPLPLEAKSLTRCLTQKHKLVTFFAIRILVIALEKLSVALKFHQQATSPTDTLWREASRRLVDEFCARIPNVKDVIMAYRAIPDNDYLQRVAASRLLVLYHEVIPQVALAGKFDFSPMLSTAIKSVEAPSQGKDEESHQEAVLRLMELENLFAVARYSPSMKWFARGKDSLTSPFITLVKLYTENSEGLTTTNWNNVFNFVAKEHELVTGDSAESGLEPLLTALRNCGTIEPGVWGFLDNCAERCARSPIKYQEMVSELVLENLQESTEEPGAQIITPLMMTMVEQLPFIISSVKDKAVLSSMAKFLSQFLGWSGKAKVPKHLLNAVLQKFVTIFGDSKARKHLSIPEISSSESATDKTSPESGVAKSADDTQEIDQEQLQELLSVPVPVAKDNNSALVKWTTKTADELVEEGYAASVIWLLASEHPSIRKEALTSITKMAAKIKESTYEENEQVWLLLSELVETVRQNESPAASIIPNVLLSFVCRALDVLKNPTHCLYPKINMFLTRGPVWDVDKLPLAQEILQEGPTEDDTHYAELSWLLSYLVDGLRGPADIALFHRRRVFERVFALHANPYMGPNLRTQVLRLTYRATGIPGGSDTLITRFGAVSWLEAQKAAAATTTTSTTATTTTAAASAPTIAPAVYQALVVRLWETCDQKRITTWSRDAVRVSAAAASA
ncbi:ribosome biogenesis protein [Xylariales sp. PMI_506]|nr:ribosome biogenesis protein [Xylariales sp. PMI_506]